jgi:hypothetical protein
LGSRKWSSTHTKPARTWLLDLPASKTMRKKFPLVFTQSQVFFYSSKNGLRHSASSLTQIHQGILTLYGIEEVCVCFFGLFKPFLTPELHGRVAYIINFNFLLIRGNFLTYPTVRKNVMDLRVCVPVSIIVHVLPSWSLYTHMHALTHYSFGCVFQHCCQCSVMSH